MSNCFIGKNWRNGGVKLLTGSVNVLCSDFFCLTLYIKSDWLLCYLSFWEEIKLRSDQPAVFYWRYGCGHNPWHKHSPLYIVMADIIVYIQRHRIRRVEYKHWNNNKTKHISITILRKQNQLLLILGKLEKRMCFPRSCWQWKNLKTFISMYWELMVSHGVISRKSIFKIYFCFCHQIRENTTIQLWADKKCQSTLR